MKKINNKQNLELLKYASVKDSFLTTQEIIKDSFKNAFKMQDENGYVIIRNNRRNNESILVSIKDYVGLIEKIERLEEEKFDLVASKINPDNYKFVDAKKLNL